MTWECIKNCKAGCCGFVPITRDLAKKNEHLTQVKPIEVVSHGDRIVVITEDLLCVFLNRKTRKCAIYDYRPEICRTYGQNHGIPCPYVDSDRNKRTMEEVKQTIKIIENQVDAVMCKKRSNGNAPSGTIDPCMRNEIKYTDAAFRMRGHKVVACCCGHGKYKKTIVVESRAGQHLEMKTQTRIPRKKKFYKRDKDGYYYIPEVEDANKTGKT